MRISIALWSSNRPSKAEPPRLSKRQEPKRNRNPLTRPSNLLRSLRLWLTTKSPWRSFRKSLRPVPKMESLISKQRKDWRKTGPTNYLKNQGHIGASFLSRNSLLHFHFFCGVEVLCVSQHMESAKTWVISTWEQSFTWLFFSLASCPSGRLSRVRLWWIPSKISCRSKRLW